MRKVLVEIILLAVSLLMSGCAIRGIDIDFVTIGNPGNPGDIRTEKNQYGKPFATPYGCGAVDYKYKISKYEITNAQWNRFIDATGIVTNYKPAYQKSRQPINSITWKEAAFFCNYLTSGDIHSGAYQFGEANTVTIDRASALLRYRKIYVLPTEDEWYKAAYYNSKRNAYSLYANGSDTLPQADNGWNYYEGEYDEPWDVGTGTKEQNGTYDIMGNVAEWNESYAELNGSPAYAMRGGSFAYRGGFKDYLASYSRSFHYPVGSLDNSFGFRVVSLECPCTPPPFSGGSDKARRPVSEKKEAAGLTASQPVRSQKKLKAGSAPEEPFNERIRAVIWEGEPHGTTFEGILQITEAKLGSISGRVNSLAFHPNGKIAFSEGYGSTPNMTMAYWNPEDISKSVVNLQYAGRSEKNDVNKTEEKGYFGFFDGPLAFDSNGICYFSLGSCGPNGLYKVVSDSPVEIEKLYSLGSTQSLQIPLFDTEHLYSTSWNGIFRYPILTDREKPVKPWFSIQGESVWLGDTLIINPDQVIAELIFRVPKETSEKGYYIKSFLFDRNKNSYKVIFVDEVGPMAISWDGQKMIRFDKVEFSINEFSLE